MHGDTARGAAHDHVFDNGSHEAERSTRVVTAITVVAMVVEIAAGWWFNSMALLADGWHMSSHAVAIGLSAVAYAAARRYARDPRFAFGTWKIEVLAAFASAIFLLGVAATMVIASVERIVSPQPIGYREAMLVAVLGLVVNVVCAALLGGAHHSDDDRAHGDADRAHGQPGDHRHGQHHHRAHHHDLNLRSAYVHVLTDAATSVLAIVALAGGWFYGWQWLDPAMGIVGALLVAMWARGLIIETSKVLLDREMDHPVVEEIRRAVEGDDGRSRVTDLHVWRVGRHVYSCALAVATHDRALNAARLRERLSAHPRIVHSTIEVELLDGTSALPRTPRRRGAEAPG